jgi:hypothetical protein
MLIRFIDVPRIAPGTAVLNLSLDHWVSRTDPAERSFAVRVVRIARDHDRQVLLPPEAGDARMIRLAPGRSNRLEVALPLVDGSETVYVSVVLLEDDDPAYLQEIASLQTVSPHGIAPHAAAGFVVNSRTGLIQTWLGRQ